MLIHPELISTVCSHQLGQCEVRAAGRPVEGGCLRGTNGIECATIRNSLTHLPEGTGLSSEQHLLDRMEQLEADLIKVSPVITQGLSHLRQVNGLQYKMQSFV